MDALGVCGGDCAADVDADGICDESTTVSANSIRAVCAMAPVRSTNADVQTFLGDCDCDGNQLDALGECGVRAWTPMTMAFVMTWRHWIDACGVATVQVRSSRADVQAFPKATAIAMATNSMPWAFVAAVAQKTLMREEDACVGELDSCVCNGPGAIYQSECSDIPEGVDCDGNQLDALGVCGGDCAADADTDGIWDDVDDCVVR